MSRGRNWALTWARRHHVLPEQQQRDELHSVLNFVSVPSIRVQLMLLLAG
jgi:hypothetical protein